MKVARLTIANFRNIRSAELMFDGHTLLVGPNNIGKSTICEALDLVLGPDRITKFPPVEEFDFYNAQYLAPESGGLEKTENPRIRIEVVLIDLDEAIENRCNGHIEFWNKKEKRLLGPGEASAANPPEVARCLRMETIALYNEEEDEFEAQTWFSHSPLEDAGQLKAVSKTIKRMFGFLYLRAIRTGSRALSLERGSLLDAILRLKNARSGLWEKVISRLREMEIEKDAAHLDPVLKSIEQKLGNYVPLASKSSTTKLHVSQLTREHLRKTMAFFLAMSKDQAHVPFQNVGTGTLNTLVLALLSFIAELKPASVMFAMEEPEIAVPPHTQRRIVDYLIQKTTQSFVTSHSPFVIERFEPSQTFILSRSEDAVVSGTKLSDASSLKDNDYKRHARRGLTECMLGRGVIVVEGVTEFYALPVAARKLEEQEPTLYPLDLAGVAFFDVGGEGSISKFGEFFNGLGLDTYAFYDRLPKGTNPAKKKIQETFVLELEHPYTGFEELISEEVPVKRLWEFLDGLKKSGENGNVGIPSSRPDDSSIKKFAKEAFSSNKGAGWAARLFEMSPVADLPASVVTFLRAVHEKHPRPAELEIEGLSDESPAEKVQTPDSVSQGIPTPQRPAPIPSKAGPALTSGSKTRK